MEYLGLLFEIIIFGAALYLYMLSSGKLHGGKQSSFVKDNAKLLKFMSLALMAVMAFEIFLNVSQLFSV